MARPPVRYKNPNFFVEVSRGKVEYYSSVIIGWHNPDVDTAASEDAWEAGGSLSYLSSAETMNIASTSANDAAAGTGVRTINVAGLDNDGNPVSEVVSMNGLTNVETSNSYKRVHTLTSLTGGSGETNAGAITATASTAGTVQCQIGVGKGVSKNSQYTIPTGKQGALVRVEVGSHKISGGQDPQVDFRGMVRPSGGVWLEVFQEIIDVGVTEVLFIDQPIMPILGAGTDFRMEVGTDQNDTEVSGRFFLLLMDL